MLLSLYPTVSGHVGWNQNRMRWKYNHSVSTFSAARVGHYMCFTVQPIPPIKHWQSFRIPYMFFKYSLWLWRFKHVIYKFSCAWCFTFWLGLPMQTETTALASMLVPSWSPQWTKNMWKIMNSFYKAKCIWSWVMPEHMYASQTWPVPEPNDPCGATPCCHNAWNCFFSMCFLWSCRGIYYPCESFNQWVIVISAFPSIRLWTCLAC